MLSSYFRPFWHPGTFPGRVFARKREDLPVAGERGQLPDPEYLWQQTDPSAAPSASEYNSAISPHKFKLENSSFFRRSSVYSSGLLREHRGPALAAVHLPRARRDLYTSSAGKQPFHLWNIRIAKTQLITGVGKGSITRLCDLAPAPRDCQLEGSRNFGLKMLLNPVLFFPLHSYPDIQPIILHH